MPLMKIAAAVVIVIPNLYHTSKGAAIGHAL